MHVIGADAALKKAAIAALEKTASQRMITDAEVLQEILHRYSAIHRPEAIQPTFDAVYSVVDEIVPIKQETVEAAKSLIAMHPGLSARDAIHVATMKEVGVTEILSFDSGFDVVPGIKRLAP